MKPAISSRHCVQIFYCHGASKAGQLDLVLSLLNKGADPETTDDSGMPALHLAASEGHIDIVADLLSRGANANAKSGMQQCTAIGYAVRRAHQMTALLLIYRGVDLYCVDTLGWSLLHSAAEHGLVEVV